MPSLALLTWAGEHPQSYFWLAGSVIVAALALAVVPLIRGNPDSVKRHDWAWGLAILAIFIAGRWPTFVLPRELNEDESQNIAGARALTLDPVFWRSVDGHTAGPLDFFALIPAGLLSGWSGYLPARYTAMALLVITFTLLHQCLSLVTGRRVARAAGLGAVVFEALTNSPDFLHCSSELLPIALWMGAAYAAIRRWVHDGPRVWNFIGGMLLGAMPLAKLQAAPLAAIFGGAWLAMEFINRRQEGLRPKLTLVGGAALPAALFSAQVTIAGEWVNVLVPFFAYNTGYVEAANLTRPELLKLLTLFSQSDDSLLHFWMPLTLLGALLMVRRRLSPDPAVPGLLWASLAASVLAVWVALFPGRPFLHYWQFTVAPISLLAGAVAGNLLSAPSQPWSRSRRLLIALCAVSIVGVLLYQRALRPNRLVQSIAAREREPISPLSARVALHARPGESLAIWGWTNSVYVETGLYQAIRCPTAAREIQPSRHRQFYRDRFLTDFVHARPELFLDSVGPFSLHYRSPALRHETEYPELAAIVRRDYVLIDDMGVGRLYRRRDLVAP